MSENRQVDELRSLARLGFDELRRATGGIGDVHRAVAQRAFGASGRGALPARTLHDAISSGVYAGLGRRHAAARDRRRRRPGASRGARRAAAVRLAPGSAARRRAERPDRRHARARGQRPPGADERARRRAAGTARASRARRGASRRRGRIVVFVHGLMETEFSWRLGAGPEGETYATRLRRDLGCTPVERPLQQRPAHLRERAVAGGPARGARGGVAGRGGVDRARRPLDGRARGALGLLPGGRARRCLGAAGAARGLAGDAAHGGAAGAGGALDERGARRAARDEAVRGLPAPAERRDPRPAPGLPGGRRLARLRPGRAARRGVPGGPAARGRHALLRGGDHHARRQRPGRPAAGRLPGARSRARRGAAGRAGSRSRRSTACTSAGRTTWRC